MPTVRQTIAVHADAPAKPQTGQPCNGCGICCLYQPCPLGILLSGRRQGACAAVRWQGPLNRYQCGAMVAPRDVLEEALPLALHGLAGGLASMLPRLARRWIAAGVGCDSTIELDDQSPDCRTPGLQR